jgi:hypothetical protein
MSSSPSRTPTNGSSKSDHQQKTKEHEGSKEGKTTILLTSLSKQLDKQNTQINKIIQILQPYSKTDKIHGKTIGTNKASTVPNNAVTKTGITSSKGDSNKNKRY